MFRAVIDNLSTLALAFILAIFIWVVAVNESNPIIEQTFKEPIAVKLLNQPNATMITNTPQTNIEVMVRGPKQEIDTLEQDNFRAAIDLSAIDYGGADVPVSVSIDNDLVSITDQSPKSIFIQLEEYRRITIPISPTITGSPTLGHIAGEPEVEPDSVVVEGAASKVDPVKSALASMSIQDSQETVNDMVTVRLRDANNRPVVGVTYDPLQVSITVPITKSAEYAELFVTLDLTGTIAAGYHLADYSLDPERIVIFGRPEVVSSLPGFISTMPLDVSGADSDMIKRVGLIVPPGVTMIGAQSVVVEIDIEPILTTVTIPWKPTILGPDAGLTATISPETVNVGLIGPLDSLSSFDPAEHLDLSVNLYQMEPGSHQVPLVGLSNLTGVDISKLLPDTVQVEISILPTPTPTPTLSITDTGVITMTNALGTVVPVTPVVTIPPPTPVAIKTQTPIPKPTSTPTPVPGG